MNITAYEKISAFTRFYQLPRDISAAQFQHSNEQLRQYTCHPPFLSTKTSDHGINDRLSSHLYITFYLTKPVHGVAVSLIASLTLFKLSKPVVLSHSYCASFPFSANG